jgi:purine-nucleoside phosphorylase
MDAAVQKHAGALHKERKLRDAVQAQLAAAEDKYRMLEQQYDVKLAEYDSLAEALERSQAAGLRRVRESAGASDASLYPARRDNFMTPQHTQQALVERMRQQANREVPPSGTMALLQGLRK